MENVRANTKKAAGIRSTYYYALQRGYSDIYEAYKRPSIYKVRAWHDCLDLCRSMNGWNIRIAAAGCQLFSVTFLYSDPDTGVIRVCWITRDHVRTTDL